MQHRNAPLTPNGRRRLVALVEEDGLTFEANATKKAREAAAASGLMTLADDSGLEVDALFGAPGVQSARFVSPAAVVVRVASAADVAPTVAAAVSRSAAHGAVRLHVTTQASDTPLWTIDRGADFEVGTDPGADLAGFAALVADVVWASLPRGPGRGPAGR